MRLLLFAVFVLSIGAGTWWILSENNDNDAVIDISSITAQPGNEAQDAKTLAEEASVSVITQTEDDANQQGQVSIAQIEDSAQDSAVNDASNTAADDNPDTPFAVVGVESRDTAQAVQDEPIALVPATSSSVAVPQQDTQRMPRTSVPIKVPVSYPVTEAEKYFIPREERTPGNLGGPPPLTFPGGPSDPNSQTDRQ